MTREEKQAALKRVRNIKPTKGFYSVKVDQILIIPADDFPKFLESLRDAKKKTNRYYSDQPGLASLSSEDMEIAPFSRAEYEAYQVAMLLKLDRDGLQTILKEQCEMDSV
jgi:hypothetical protein